MEHSLFILGVLGANIALSIWLERNTRLRQLGAALMAILITAITANLGIIPSSESEVPLYNGIFNYVAPISIFYLLLGVNLKALKKAGKPMIVLFIMGAIGTCTGVYIADWTTGEALGKWSGPIGGMITGTYIGGSVNFNAVALHYDMMEKGAIYASIVAVDNIYTTLWMIATLAIPVVMNRWIPRSSHKHTPSTSTESFDRSGFDVFRLALLIVLGAFSLWISRLGASILADWGLTIPSILLLTTLALILAQFPWVQKLKEANILGLYLVYIFLAVIGAYCNFSALGGVGAIAGTLLIYLFIVVVIHGIIALLAGWWLGYDWEMVAIASQANVGGSSSALALAKSMKRDDLLLAAVLIGSLGNGLGTYLGFMMAGWL